MSNNFKKSLIVAGLALVAVEANANTVMIGCAAPGNSTSGATVYSVDAYDNNGTAISLPGAVASGSVCSRAINAMLQQAASATANGVASSGTYRLVGANNVTITNTGYSLQQFVLSNQELTGFGAGVVPTTGQVSLIGCAAPASGTTGATVYSVDAQNSAGTAVTGSAGLLAQKCSQALGYMDSTVGGGSSSAAGNNTVTPVNLTIGSAGYSLQQFIIQ